MGAAAVVGDFAQQLPRWVVEVDDALVVLFFDHPLAVGVVDVVGLHGAVEFKLAHAVAGVVGPAFCAVLQGVAVVVVADGVAIACAQAVAVCGVAQRLCLRGMAAFADFSFAVAHGVVVEGGLCIGFGFAF